MPSGQNQKILESLHRLETKLDCVITDFTDLRERMAMIGQGGTQVEVVLAGVSARLDQVDERLHRIEHRIDLVIEEIETDAALETRQ
jgi:hypothetical protein